MDWVIETQSPQETIQVGSAVGERLAAGDVVCLVGDLGAGKTQFTKGLARGLGLPDVGVVTSPTFVLMNSYETRVPLRHYDLYRLEGGEMESLGFYDMKATSVVVVEWGEKAGDTLGDRLEIRFDVLGETSRRLAFRALGSRPSALLAGLKGLKIR